MNKKIAVVTGAAGFAGYHVTEKLIEHGYFVYAMVREGSKHNERLAHFKEDEIKLVYADMQEMDTLSEKIHNKCDVFFHLAWAGGRNNFDEQTANINPTVQAVEQAAKLGCKRIVCIGSQAEYGAVRDEVIKEDRLPNPHCAYGSAKVAALYLSRNKASQLGIEWIWGRIFSLYGKYEPGSRMLPFLVNELQDGNDIKLSSCEQAWDYLYAPDAAEAIIALGEKAKTGEIYNIADGRYKKLKEFVEDAKQITNSTSEIHYGDDPNPFVSLQVSVEKIQKDTGWKPKRCFEDGIKDTYNYNYGNE